MRKLLRLFCIFCFILNFSELLSSNDDRNLKAQLLIDHVIQSIDYASKGISKLNEEILEIPGMSSSKVRHLLNNLCSYPKTNYLEIGCWKGSTWVSALFGNEGFVLHATAVDDWSLFDGPSEDFHRNCKKLLNNFPFVFYSQDCFSIDVQSDISGPVTTYFYDGGHTALDQERAFTYYDKILDDVFIAVVDDWNFPEVPLGTKSAFDKLGYSILYEAILPSSGNGDKQNWWNGFYVAVIKKE